MCTDAQRFLRPTTLPICELHHYSMSHFVVSDNPQRTRGPMKNDLNTLPINEPPRPRWIGAERIGELLSMAEAVDVLDRTLQGGFDPELDGTRSRLATPHGQ